MSNLLRGKKKRVSNGCFSQFLGLGRGCKTGGQPGAALHECTCIVHTYTSKYDLEVANCVHHPFAVHTRSTVTQAQLVAYVNPRQPATLPLRPFIGGPRNDLLTSKSEGEMSRCSVIRFLAAAQHQSSS